MTVISPRSARRADARSTSDARALQAGSNPAQEPLHADAKGLQAALAQRLAAAANRQRIDARREDTGDATASVWGDITLSTIVAGPAAWHLAIAVIIISVLSFALALPFVRLPLANVPAFIPAYQSALAINDLITAVLLFANFGRLRNNWALLPLAAGYLFCALIIVVHTLTFPGVFAPGGLLGAGSQSTAWLYVFWHAGFPLSVIAYAELRDRRGTASVRPEQASAAIALAVLLVVAAAVSCALLATAGMDLLPIVIQGNDYSLLVSKGVSPALILLCIVALALLLRRRPARVLDLWLIVVMCVWLCDIGLSAVFGSARFDLGWYAGRSYGLLAASFVLVMLLLETSGLHARLSVAGATLAERARALENRVQERTIELHRSDEALKREEAKLRQAAAVFTSTHDGVVITNPAGAITAVNPAFCSITGYAEAEVLGGNMRILQSGRHDRAFYRDMWGALRATGHWQGELWNRRKNGEVYPQWLTLSAVRDDSGEVVSYVGVFSDITSIKESEVRLEHLAHHDPLTSLPNRLVLLSHLEKSIARARRNQERCAVLFLDLDRFKTVNDSLGHAVGDELLIQVAHRLRERIRSADMLARMGGDEFVVVLDSIAGPQNAASVAESLIDQFKTPFLLSGEHEVYVGISIGISLFPDDGEVAQKLIQFADAALYQAKEAGRNTYRFYTSALTIAANTRLEMEARVRRALEREEFVLHYQPLVSVMSGETIGVEALLRWQDPNAGLVPPGQFIRLAEETGIILPLGDWVLRTACAQMQRWLAEGRDYQTVSVNLSARQFQQSDLCERIQAVLTETGLPAERLELEITESMLLDHAKVAGTLAKLKRLGVRLAIDDFGTGYSSLGYLKRLSIDKLKVDQSFVRDIPGSSTAMEITAAIVALAKSLKLQVLAEGVETEPQLAFLRSLGCDIAQGFLFGRPVPHEPATIH